RPGAVKRRSPAETNDYEGACPRCLSRLVAALLVVQPSARGGRVEDLRRHHERKRDRVPGALDLERLDHRLDLRLRPGLHLGEPAERADDGAEVVRGVDIPRLRGESASYAAVDVRADREPGN